MRQPGAVHAAGRAPVEVEAGNQAGGVLLSVCQHRKSWWVPAKAPWDPQTRRSAGGTRDGSQPRVVQRNRQSLAVNWHLHWIAPGVSSQGCEHPACQAAWVAESIRYRSLIERVRDRCALVAATDAVQRHPASSLDRSAWWHFRVRCAIAFDGVLAWRGCRRSSAE
jgi:hypothetical protein